MSPLKLREILPKSLEARRYVRECGLELRVLEIALTPSRNEVDSEIPLVPNAAPEDAARLLRATLADPSYQRLSTIIEIARRYDIRVPTDAILQEVQDRALLGELRVYESVCRDLRREPDRKIWTRADKRAKELSETLQRDFKRASDSSDREFVHKIADTIRSRWEPHFGGSQRDYYSTSQWLKLAARLSLDAELAEFALQFLDRWSDFRPLAVEATLALRNPDEQRSIALVAADQGIKEVIPLFEAIGVGPRDWERAALAFRRRGEAALEIQALENCSGPEAAERLELLQQFRILTARDSTIEQDRPPLW